MSANTDVLLVTGDPSLRSMVDAVLMSNGRTWSKDTVGSLRDMQAHLSRSEASAVLVDVDGDPQQSVAALEPTCARYPSVKFVALSSTRDQDLLLMAMQAGVRHVLLKQELATELPKLLHRVIASAPAQMAESGNLFVVLSAGGGCGASTIAVSLAEELAASAQRPSLLIDLDLSYGALATILNVEWKYGIDHVLSHQDVIDTHLISTAATPCSEKLHLLPTPRGVDLDSSGRLDLSRLSDLLMVARQAYRNVVVDAPRATADVAASLAAASTRTLLVLQLTVKDVRIARSIATAMSIRGVPAEAMLPVVNRYAKRQHSVSLQDACNALGVPHLEVIRNDYASASRAMDFGQTIASAAPRSPMRKDLQALLAKMRAPATAA